MSGRSWGALLVVLVGLAACAEPADPPSGSAVVDVDENFDAPLEATVYDAPHAGADPRFAALSAREPFGFGTPADEARIALWDIDVKPDGEGLPEGQGTVAEGRIVYAAQCMACHGATGVEGPNDRLVGTDPWGRWPATARTIGNYWPYATTLFDFISKAMPQITPGVLTADETYSVIAYLLYMNELWPEDGVLDRTTLPAVEMPARNRFVPDDRVGGAEVR